jgi:hypothetical protein
LLEAAPAAPVFIDGKKAVTRRGRRLHQLQAGRDRHHREGGMKRLTIFILLGPVLFVLCIWVLFLPLASLVEGRAVRFNLEVDSNLAVLLGVMFGGFVLAVVDWVAEMLVMRPWFTALAGWALGALTIGAWFDLSQPI